MLDSHSEFTKSMLQRGKTVPNELVSCAEGNLMGFRSLKGEIDTELLVVHERMQKITNIIKENIKNESNPYGYLTQNQQDYLTCLQFQH